MYNSNPERYYQANNKKYFCKLGQVFKTKGKHTRYFENKTCTKYCKYHWKDWAKRTALKVIRAERTETFYYRVRIDRPRQLSSKDWSNIMFLLVKKLKNRPGKVSYLWVRHNDIKESHYHVILQADTPIDEEATRLHFRKLLSHAVGDEVSTSVVSILPCDSYRDYVWYIFGCSHVKPRVYPPWLGIEGKTYYPSRNFYTK